MSFQSTGCTERSEYERELEELATIMSYFPSIHDSYIILKASPAFFYYTLLPMIIGTRDLLMG